MEVGTEVIMVAVEIGIEIELEVAVFMENSNCITVVEGIRG